MIYLNLTEVIILKKIIMLFLSIIMVAVFSITTFAVEESSSESGSSESSSSSASSSSSNVSSANSSEQSSSSSSAESSSFVDSTTSSETQPAEDSTVLKIVRMPQKTVYNVGDKLDLTGLRVNIISNGSVIISSDGSNLTASISVFANEGKQTVTLTYGDASDSFEVTVNPKHTHKYGAWNVKTSATCEIDGVKVRTCECGDVQTAKIEATGHDWDEGTIIKEASTKSEGIIKYVCINCKNEKAEKIPIIEKEKFKITVKFELKWWVIILPVVLIVILYILALKIIFEKQA